MSDFRNVLDYAREVMETFDVGTKEYCLAQYALRQSRLTQPAPEAKVDRPNFSISCRKCDKNLVGPDTDWLKCEPFFQAQGWRGAVCPECQKAPAPDAASTHPNLQADTAHHAETDTSENVCGSGVGRQRPMASLPPVGPAPAESEPTAAPLGVSAESIHAQMYPHDVEPTAAPSVGSDQPRQAATREALIDCVDAQIRKYARLLSPTTEELAEWIVEAIIAAFPERTAKAVGVVDEVQFYTKLYHSMMDGKYQGLGTVALQIAQQQAKDVIASGLIAEMPGEEAIARTINEIANVQFNAWMIDKDASFVLARAIRKMVGGS